MLFFFEIDPPVIILQSKPGAVSAGPLDVYVSHEIFAVCSGVIDVWQRLRQKWWGI